MHQIILLKLLFIAGHFVLSSPWQNVKAVLSVAFSFQHLHGSDMLPLPYTGENRQTVMIKAAGQPTAGIGNFWCCIAVLPPVKDQISPFSDILVGFLNLPTCHVMDSFCPSFSLLLKCSKMWWHETFLVLLGFAITSSLYLQFTWK